MQHTTTGNKSVTDLRAPAKRTAQSMPGNAGTLITLVTKYGSSLEKNIERKKIV